MINLESNGSMAPREASKAFCCVGHVLSTSRADMDIGDLAKSSTILYLTVAFAVVLLARGLKGICGPVGGEEGEEEHW